MVRSLMLNVQVMTLIEAELHACMMVGGVGSEADLASPQAFLYLTTHFAPSCLYFELLRF